MSEMPKLKLCESVFVENIGNKDEINFVVNNHNKEYIITLSSLKEVNAFWDKYKNNCTSFWKDYPEHFKNNLIQFPKWNEEGIIFDCEVNHLIFKDWLHSLLYKVGD